MSASLTSSPARHPVVSHAGSGPLNANTGPGEQRNHDQSGSYNRQTNVGGPITNYYEAHRAETPPPAVNTVPFARDKGFIDRAELTQLERKLSQPGTRVALYGLGGVGKSQLAIEYCYRLKKDSSDTWVLWIHTSSASRFDQDVRKLAEDVRIPGRNEQGANVFQLVYNWLLDSRHAWLIVLDNADDVKFLFEPPTSTDGSTRPRIGYFPPCEHGAMLITSRRRGEAARLADAEDLVELKASKEHAIALVKRGLDGDIDDRTSEKLAVKLECMPLAIAQATAYIRRERPLCTVDGYITKLDEGDDMQGQLLGEEFEGLRRDVQEASNSILTALRISFEHIHKHSRTAADLLSLMSFYNHQGIPRPLLTAGVSRSPLTASDPIAADQRSGDGSSIGLTENSVRSSLKGKLKGMFKGVQRGRRRGKQSVDTTAIGQTSAGDDADFRSTFDADITTLRDHSFISVTPGGSTFEMHRLVQLAAQVWLKQEGRHGRWEVRSLRQLDSALPDFDWKRVEEYRALYPHARQMFNSETKDRDALLSLSSVLYKVGWFAWWQGSHVETEATAKRSEEIRRSLLGEASEETLDSLHLRGGALRGQGKYGEAEEIFRRVLRGRERAFGEDHRRTLEAVTDLANALRGRGDHEEAEELSRRALSASQKALGEKHPDTLTNLYFLALVLRDQRKYEQAEGMMRRVLEGREEVRGKDHPNTLLSVGLLAETLRCQGKYEEAEELSTRALEGAEEKLGKEHPTTLDSVWISALVHRDRGHHPTALALYQRAAAGYTKKLYGPTNPDTVHCLADLRAFEEEMRTESSEAGSSWDVAQAHT